MRNADSSRQDRADEAVLDVAGLLASEHERVGAGNSVTLCDLGIFADEAAEPVPAQNLDVRASLLTMDHQTVPVSAVEALSRQNTSSR